MERPYIMCHILCSLDGKIAGPFMETPAVGAAGAEYARLRAEWEPDAMLYGTTTTKEFTGGRTPVLTAGAEAPEGDYAAPHTLRQYYVSLDAAGEIAWESGVFRRPGRPDCHVIEVLTGQTPAAYRAYLRERGVSYLIAGEASLDCAAAAQKLYRLFGIERLMLCGGGAANWSFLRQGMMDELSLVLAPAADGEPASPSVFSRMGGLAETAPAQFRLKAVEQLGDSVHLSYRVSR